MKLLSFFVLVQLDAEHGLFQLAAALSFQAGLVGFTGQIEGEAPLAEHPGDAGACGADGQVSGLVGGLGGGQLAQRDFEQLAAFEVGLKGQVEIGRASCRERV